MTDYLSKVRSIGKVKNQRKNDKNYGINDYSKLSRASRNMMKKVKNGKRTKANKPTY